MADERVPITATAAGTAYLQRTGVGEDIAEEEEEEIPIEVPWGPVGPAEQTRPGCINVGVTSSADDKRRVRGSPPSRGVEHREKVPRLGQKADPSRRGCLLILFSRFTRDDYILYRHA